MTPTPLTPPHRLIPGVLLLFVLPAFAQWGDIDPTFLPGGGRNAGFDNDVFTIGIQPDGKLLVTGFFQNVDRTSRSGVARLHPGGGLDIAFNPGAGATTPNGLPHTVEAQVLLPDGRVIVGGRFEAFDGVAQPFLARLNTNGSLDASYRPAIGGLVAAMVLQPDGRLVLGGSFQSINGVPRNRIARLKTDGSLDTSFDPGTGADKSVAAVAQQPDGKILIAGAFTNFNGIRRPRIARLNPGGSLDGTFDPGGGPNAPVVSVAPLPDGRLMIGGEFTQYADTPINYVARLKTDGLLDSTFAPDIALVFGGVLAVQPTQDAKILVSGEFAMVDGETRINLARLDPQGALDASFDPGAGPSGGFNPRVRVLALQPDGKVLIGGGFTRFDGVDLNYIARLGADQGGSVEFTAATYQAAENDTSATITVQRTGSTNGTLAVGYAAFEGTATAGADFLPTTGALIFAPGETLQSFTVSILPDVEQETDETVTLGLGPPAGGAILGALRTAILTIANQTNTTPQLVIQSILVANGDATITWASVAGRNYQVEFKTNLTDAAWGSLVGDVSATGPTAMKVDATLQESERFYRVRQLP